MKSCVPLLGLSILASMVVACGAGGKHTLGGGGGAGGTGGGGITLIGPGTGGGGPSVNLGGNGTVDPNDTRDVPIRKKVCDASGACTCLRLALVGTLASAANTKNTDAFTGWLNGSSNGSATVTTFSTKPTVDDAFLAQFDVLLVANVNGWKFSDAEKAAVANWVNTGGGIITLTGFTSTDTEPADTSQLISFSGLGYTSTKSAVGGDSLSITYDGKDIPKYCLGWSGPGNSDAQGTTPIPFTPETGDLGKLTYSLNNVGAYIGWGVTAPAGATVVATDPMSKQPMAVALEVASKGRIYAYGDEWVTLQNQWVSTGNPPNSTQQDQYNLCYHMASDAGASDPNNFFYSVVSFYQTKQFWYNAINWVAPPNECNFVIVDSDVQIPPR